MRIIDLFSGVGGLTFGFYYRKYKDHFVRNRKNQFVFANEYNPLAAKAYSENYPDIPMKNCDIKSLKESDIRKWIGSEPVELVDHHASLLVPLDNEITTKKHNCIRNI